jgi:nucleoside-diphosphate-sugar epimerase
MVRDDVVRAADGVRAIVHAANPPGYRNWAGLVLPMIDNTLAAAAREGARILLPGNVYNYGPDAFGEIAEDAPQQPLTRKGRIRAAMERRLREAAQKGAKSVVLRAGDFFGAGATQGWMAILLGKGRPLRSLAYPGPRGVRHAWAYLPDLAETAAALLDREADLAAVASFHFRGHAVTGDELVAAIGGVVGAKVGVRPFPWLAVGALGPFNETMRELFEMRYLWRETVLLDNSRLTALLGEEPHTPLEAAIAATLAGRGAHEAAQMASAA